MIAGMPEFEVSPRGYDVNAVQDLVGRAESALAGRDPAQRAQALAAIREAKIGVVLRGYDRAQVDQYLAQVTRELGG
ncbi:DivIVA domain-containing protein [Dactylosporangium sp. NPDC000244]|uniref:DivIVA domain-containing protein n=1 Tax=Dactylosporangium sp. NPDC000244 TaxID=3154365 RepID=UPI00331786DD